MIFNPRFYLLRLRHASLAELFCRTRQQAALYRLKWIAKQVGHVLQPPEQSKARATIASLRMPDLIPRRQQAPFQEVDSIHATHLPHPLPTDPKVGEMDIRLRWESARLQRATALILYPQLSAGGDETLRAKQAAGNLIVDWLNANPFPSGVHYQSAMECGLRIPVFFYACKQIQSINPVEYDGILAAIFRHAVLVAKKLSLHSSLGNHTIAEAVGLIFAGAIYQSSREGRRWLDVGIELLNNELTHQILEDGGPAEQSLGYHRFVLDLYWLAMDFIQKNNLGNVDPWGPRLTAGESFLLALQDQRGQHPVIGDSDDGFAVAPDLSPARGPLPSKIENHITFAESGYTVIRNDCLVFTFDHGPLGMAPYFNHGHADALSITLSKNGYPLLVDPGTYRYNGVPRWRRYFKGTRAHNTVTIDDQDQAIQETGFIWSKSYSVQLAAFDSGNGELLYNATHDGYLRLRSPVRHHRSVFFFDGENFLVKDRFVGTGMHCFQINFHLHPDASVALDGPWWVADHGGERIYLRLLEGAFQSVRGRNNPLMGWFSRRYGQKEPTTTLTFTRTGEAESVVFTTVISTRAALGDDRIDIKEGEFESKIKNS